MQLLLLIKLTVFNCRFTLVGFLNFCMKLKI